MISNSIVRIAVISFLLIGVLFIQPVQGAEGSDRENPKVAVVGVNTGNISSNVAGGRFFFNFSLEPDNSYNFALQAPQNTKFDLYFFDSSYLPAIIVEESKDFDDTGSYPVEILNFDSENDWVLIQVYSDNEDGGTGTFTLTISNVHADNQDGENGSDNIGNGTNTNPLPGNELLITGIAIFACLASRSRKD